MSNKIGLKLNDLSFQLEGLKASGTKTVGYLHVDTSGFSDHAEYILVPGSPLGPGDEEE